MNEVITLGFIDKGTGKHQSNIVYFRGVLSDNMCKLWSKATASHVLSEEKT